MKNTRLIARLDIKAPNLIKGVHLEGLRVMGDPYAFAKRYYECGIDEIIYMDVVASLYNRNSLIEIVRRTARDVFIPFTVGGGLRTVSDMKEILRSGADKVAINTAAIKDPALIEQGAKFFGSQCIVLSIEAKKIGPNKWEAFTDNGRERTHLDVVEWAQKGVALGAGEILLTSIDNEGTRRGFDVDLVRAVSSVVSIPVIASGGMGSCDDLARVVQVGGADGVAMADVLHYDRISLEEIRSKALVSGVSVRVP